MKIQRKVFSACLRGVFAASALFSGALLHAQSFSNPASFQGASADTTDYSSLLGLDPVVLLCLGAGVVWFMLMASVSIMARNEIKHSGRSS